MPRRRAEREASSSTCSTCSTARFAIRATRLVLSGVPTRARVSPNGRRGGNHDLRGGGIAGRRTARERVDSDRGRASGRVTRRPSRASRLRCAADQRAHGAARHRERGVRATAIASSRRCRRPTRAISSSGSVTGRRLRRDRPRTGERGAVAGRPAPGRQEADRASAGSGSSSCSTWRRGRETPLNQGAAQRRRSGRVAGRRARRLSRRDATTGTGIWMLPTDGTTGPRLLVPDAFSPAVQR